MKTFKEMSQDLENLTEEQKEKMAVLMKQTEKLNEAIMGVIFAESNGDIYKLLKNFSIVATKMIFSIGATSQFILITEKERPHIIEKVNLILDTLKLAIQAAENNNNLAPTSNDTMQ